MISNQAMFHRCPTLADCPHCGSTAEPLEKGEFNWSFLDGVYCISLISREDRARSAIRELHRVGLCYHTKFYRPQKAMRRISNGIWESHRAIAIDAYNNDFERILILEDDVCFSKSFGHKTPDTINQAIQKLPSRWNGFYLGHIPIFGVFYKRRILRVSSLTTHAYVASRRLIYWLREHPFEKIEKSIGGKGIDVAFSRLPHMYALFPMIAVQNGMMSDRKIRPTPRLLELRKHIKRLSGRRGVHEFLISHIMKPAEIFIVVFSPVFFLLGIFELPRALYPTDSED